MRVIRTGLRQGLPGVIVLGTFDGVHLGHMELLKEGIRLREETGAVLRACTFDRHPLQILRPDRAPELLSDIPQKARLMSRADADEMMLIPFSRKTAETTPEEFLEALRNHSGIRAAVAGWNYTFGKGGSGNTETLLRDGERHGYPVVIVPPVKTREGIVISSTEIRNRLHRGEIREANGMLGYRYTLSGIVFPGGGLPAEPCRIGFSGRFRPVIPADGCYRVSASFSDGTRIGQAVLRMEAGVPLLAIPGENKKTGQHVRIEFEG